MIDEYMRFRIICQWSNNWKYKSFALGVNLAYEKRQLNEFYIALHLGFWQLFIGFAV